MNIYLVDYDTSLNVALPTNTQLMYGMVIIAKDPEEAIQHHPDTIHSYFKDGQWVYDENWGVREGQPLSLWWPPPDKLVVRLY